MLQLYDVNLIRPVEDAGRKRRRIARVSFLCLGILMLAQAGMLRVQTLAAERYVSKRARLREVSEQNRLAMVEQIRQLGELREGGKQLRAQVQELGTLYDRSVVWSRVLARLSQCRAGEPITIRSMAARRHVGGLALQLEAECDEAMSVAPVRAFLDRLQADPMFEDSTLVSVRANNGPARQFRLQVRVCPEADRAPAHAALATAPTPGGSVQ